MTTPRTIHASEQFRALLFGDPSGKLIVTFDHWSHGKSGFGPWNQGKFWAKQGFSQLSIKTARNDWFVNDDTARLEAALRETSARFQRIHALGFSMGGYAALRLSAALKPTRVLLVSPQFSVWREHAGNSLWCDRYEGSGTASQGALADHGDPKLTGDLVYDPFDVEDALHARLCLRTFENLTPVPLPFAGHPAHQAMSDCGQFRTFQKAGISRQSSAQDIRKGFKSIRRTSDRYQKNLAKHLKVRNARAK